jgi:hypothetical protein
VDAFATATIVITYVTTGVAWAFIIMYHALSHGGWRRDPIGRHLMALAGVDASIFSMLTAASLWPWLALQPWFRWVYLGMVSGIAGVTAWRAVILWRLYHINPPAADAAPPHRRAAMRRRVKIKHPFLLWQSVLAGLQVVNASLLTGTALEKVALFVGAAQLATTFYARGNAAAPTVPTGGTS